MRLPTRVSNFIRERLDIAGGQMFAADMMRLIEDEFGHIGYGTLWSAKATASITTQRTSEGVVWISPRWYRSQQPTVPPGWEQDAACRGMDTNLFFPERNTSEALAAQKVCDHCPVQQECLLTAIDERHEFGIWGGLSANQRANNYASEEAR